MNKILHNCDQGLSDYSNSNLDTGSSTDFSGFGGDDSGRGGASGSW